ncbi:MAG TPA: hypothetical protein ENI64_04385 [Gammaproteobacteria bacterium]|nr:hypothetical protein [Gammaproteobacteria bacterium]
MTDKKKIAGNVGSSVVQVVVSGLTVFLLYRYLLETIGPDKLGIWALVLAASSTVQAANLGMTGSVIKYIADYDALGDTSKIALAVQTAAVSIGVFSLVFVLILFPAANYYFQFSLDDAGYREAVEILPQALLAFWIYMVAGIYQSALYGCQLIAHRNAILMIDSVMYMLMSFVLAPIYGLPGLAWARVVQNLVTYLLSASLMKRHIRQVPLLPRAWRKGLFKEMFGYAVNFQIIAILVMLLDPVTKGFLSRYGNISMVAYYEMARKLVQLFRGILANANQVLVPSYARFKQLDEARIAGAYRLSYGVVFYFAVPGFCLMAVAAPLVSELWVGHYEPVFVAAVVLLCIGWLINTLGVPAYHAGMGTGHMKDNVVAHVLMTLANIALILLIGRLWQGLGVIVAWVLALSLGGLLLISLYHYRNSLALRDVIPGPSRALAALCLAGVVVGYVVWYKLSEFIVGGGWQVFAGLFTQSVVDAVMILAFGMLVVVPMWKHPVRRQLMTLLRGAG